MKKVMTSLAFIVGISAYAQVGINATESEIASDAVFQVKNKAGEKKGVILPEVTLSNSTEVLNGSANSDGLLVWNNGGSLGKGYYYWDGDAWAKVGGGSNTLKKVESVTSAGIYASSADTGLIVNNSGDAITINLTASEIEGKEVCVFQKDNGSINFSKPNMKGSGITFASNVGGCYTWDGSNWLGTFAY